MNIAIFILPEGNLKKRIKGWKKKIKKEIFDSPYVDHPPHMTLMNINISTSSEKKCINILKNLTTSIKPFKMKIINTGIFWDDKLTGGHTLFYGIEQNKRLNNLQMTIAEGLKPMLKKNVKPHKLLNGDLVLNNSFKKYGFPFAGSHWIPHFSVASLKVKRNNSIIKEYLSEKINYRFLTNQIAVFRIIEDDHLLLRKINF